MSTTWGANRLIKNMSRMRFAGTILTASYTRNRLDVERVSKFKDCGQAFVKGAKLDRFKKVRSIKGDLAVKLDAY